MTHDLITKCATLENNLQIKVRTKDIPNNIHPRKKNTDLANPAIFAVISLSSVSVSQDFTPRHKPTVLQYRIRERLFVLANFDPHFFHYSFCFPFFSSKKTSFYYFQISAQPSRLLPCFPWSSAFPFSVRSNVADTPRQKISPNRSGYFDSTVRLNYTNFSTYEWRIIMKLVLESFNPIPE